MKNFTRKIFPKSLNFFAAGASDFATHDGRHARQSNHLAGRGARPHHATAKRFSTIARDPADREQTAPPKARTLPQALLRRDEERKPRPQTTRTVAGRSGGDDRAGSGGGKANAGACHHRRASGAPALARASGDRARGARTGGSEATARGLAQAGRGSHRGAGLEAGEVHQAPLHPAQVCQRRTHRHRAAARPFDREGSARRGSAHPGDRRQV